MLYKVEFTISIIYKIFIGLCHIHLEDIFVRAADYKDVILTTDILIYFDLEKIKV